MALRKKKTPRDAREGGIFWNSFYKYLAGPATTENAIEGVTPEAREAWKRDLERRKEWSRRERERKRAERDARSSRGNA